MILTRNFQMNTDHRGLREDMSKDVLKQCSPDSVDLKKSGDSRRCGIYFLIFGIFVIIGFTILYLYCFLVEYRLVKIAKTLNDFDTRQKEIEDKWNLLMLKNAQMEKSIYVWNRLKPQASSSLKKSPSNMESRPMIHLENNQNSLKENELEAAQTLNFWKEADWVRKVNKKNNFQFNASTGHVSVSDEGAYLVYVQLVFIDSLGRWSIGVDVDGEVRAKCLESEQLKPAENSTKDAVYKQCSITTIVYLNSKQSVSIKNAYGHRTILLKPEVAFWGVIKLT